MGGYTTISLESVVQRTETAPRTSNVGSMSGISCPITPQSLEYSMITSYGESYSLSISCVESIRNAMQTKSHSSHASRKVTASLGTVIKSPITFPINVVKHLSSVLAADNVALLGVVLVALASGEL